MRFAFKLLLAMCFILPQPVTAADECPNLLDSVRSEFQKSNPAIADIQILDSKPMLAEYWVIARGITEGWEFKGSFEDELFGVFVVDTDFETVIAVVDVIPTPRWADYEMWITDYDMTSVTVRGHGSTYEDNPFEKSYQAPPK